MILRCILPSNSCNSGYSLLQILNFAGPHINEAIEALWSRQTGCCSAHLTTLVTNFQTKDPAQAFYNFVCSRYNVFQTILLEPRWLCWALTTLSSLVYCRRISKSFSGNSVPLICTHTRSKWFVPVLPVVILWKHSARPWTVALF
jgi:hypothetical protein